MKSFPLLTAALLGAALTSVVLAFPRVSESVPAKTGASSFLQVGKKYQFSWTNHRHATVLEIHPDGWVKVSADAAQGEDVVEWLNIDQIHFVRELPPEGKAADVKTK